MKTRFLAISGIVLILAGVITDVIGILFFDISANEHVLNQ